MEEITEKYWLFKTSSDPSLVREFSEKLNIHTVLADILIQRGITSFEEAKIFFRPSLDMLHDPWLMKDMDKAVSRIERAIKKKEKIMILGDYDVDGTTAAALSFGFMKQLTPDVEVYIPDRYGEGYGISIKAIDYAEENGISLIISLDCGIKANEKVDYASSKGIDFIISDHHNPGTNLPNAVAVLDPKRADCSYPYDSLSGCGVAFKLMTALADRFKKDKNKLFEYLDLVATSIAADIVPITGENRILARFGLEKISKNPSPGIEALKEKSGKKIEYTIGDVVFKLAPRINSAGRMNSGKKAVEILISENLEEARNKIEEINKFNDDRREADSDITKHAFELIEKDITFSSRNTTVLHDPSWHKGVIGIVASRLIEKYYRPTIIFTGSEGVLSGSARSVRNFDLYAALEVCSDLLLQFGGHKYAAGMTLKEENFEKFRNEFDKVVSEMIREEHLRPVVEIDAEISLQDITKSFFAILKQFSPFGPDNMNPVFISPGVVITDLKVLTDKNNRGHLKFKVSDQLDVKKKIDVIGFGMGDYYGDLDDGIVIDLVYCIEENLFNGRTSLQLVAKDLKIN